MADSQRKTANLFDKDTAPSLSLYINTGDMIIRTNADARLTYIPCKANTEYIVLKNSGTRFTIATTATVPDANVSILNYSVDNTGSMLRITTTSTSEYLAVWYWRTADTITEEQMRDSIMIVEGSTAPSSYEPYGWLHSLRKLGTSTDTITTLPADVYADGNNATVGLVGNMSQTGIPTPQNPTQPQETGERTGNLFDYTTMATSAENSYLNPDGTIGASNDWNISDYIPCDGTEFTLSYVGGNTPAFCLYDENKQYITGKSYNTGGASIKWAITITSQTVAKYIRFSYCKANPPSGDTLSSIMLNTGSTALPHEPYGYKIPILSNSTTTNVYLGEVQSTRRVKKLVLTGQEDWTLSSSRIFYTPVTPTAYNNIALIMCSHFEKYTDNQNLGVAITNVGEQLRLYDVNSVYSDVTAFKTFLAAQYANGTPVCVWYVLATPQTAVVNEPLRKIGDYADTVSGISIPTTTGKDTFDVDTTLKPSEVSLAYTGWHDATVKEWDGSEWQDEQPVSLLSAPSRPTLTESTPDIMDITEPEEKE